MSTGKMSAHCQVCADFASSAGAVVRRVWELQLDKNIKSAAKAFLLQDNKQWLQLLHQAWWAHQVEAHALRLRLPSL